MRLLRGKRVGYRSDRLQWREDIRGCVKVKMGNAPPIVLSLD
jgi:hypothetical protein